jgi:hypothetical protein
MADLEADIAILKTNELCRDVIFTGEHLVRTRLLMHQGLPEDEVARWVEFERPGEAKAYDLRIRMGGDREVIFDRVSTRVEHRVDSRIQVPIRDPVVPSRSQDPGTPLPYQMVDAAGKLSHPPRLCARRADEAKLEDT